VPALIQLLEDKDQEWTVRYRAAQALGEIGEGAKDVVPALIQALQDQDDRVRALAAETLERIGTPEALKAVEEYQSQQ